MGVLGSESARYTSRSIRRGPRLVPGRRMRARTSSGPAPAPRATDGARARSAVVGPEVMGSGSHATGSGPAAPGLDSESCRRPTSPRSAASAAASSSTWRTASHSASPVEPQPPPGAVTVTTLRPPLGRVEVTSTRGSALRIMGATDSTALATRCSSDFGVQVVEDQRLPTSSSRRVGSMRSGWSSASSKVRAMPAP